MHIGFSTSLFLQQCQPSWLSSALTLAALGTSLLLLTPLTGCGGGDPTVITKDPDSIEPDGTPDAPPLPPPPKIKIYYEGAFPPFEMLEGWTKDQGVEYEAIKLAPSAIKGTNIPTDGDLYVVSPRLFMKLDSLITWRELDPDRHSDKELNPLLTNHKYDIDNQYSRPWRWTPYVFYFWTSKPEEEKANIIFRKMVTNVPYQWSDDWSILFSFWMKQSGYKSVTPINSKLKSEWETFYKRIHFKVGNEENVWNKLIDQKIRISFLPAAFWQRDVYAGKLTTEVEKDERTLKWIASSKGTVIDLEILAINGASEHPNVTEGLLTLLTSKEIQDQIMPLSGYFPARSHIREPMATAIVPMPETPRGQPSWFQRSEFVFHTLSALGGKPEIKKEE